MSELVDGNAAGSDGGVITRDISISTDNWVDIGPASTFGVRTNIRVHGRKVTVLRLKERGRRGGVSWSSKWHVFDSVCYHAGGPLHEGTLVQVAGRTCLRCPWHSYLIDIESGDGLYMDLNRRYQTKGIRQRVHDVKVDEDGHVYVRLKLEGNIPSDDYAYGLSFQMEKDNELPSFPKGNDTTNGEQKRCELG